MNKSTRSSTYTYRNSNSANSNDSQKQERRSTFYIESTSPMETHTPTSPTHLNDCNHDDYDDDGDDLIKSLDTPINLLNANTKYNNINNNNSNSNKDFLNTFTTESTQSNEVTGALNKDLVIRRKSFRVGSILRGRIKSDTNPVVLTSYKESDSSLKEDIFSVIKETANNSHQSFFSFIHKKQSQIPAIKITYQNELTDDLSITHKPLEPPGQKNIEFIEEKENDLSLQVNNIIINKEASSIINAAEKFELIFGSELSNKLICDNTTSIKLNSKMNIIDRNSIDSTTENSLISSFSDLSVSKSSSSSISPHYINTDAVETATLVDEQANELFEKKKKQKLDEYYRIEEKQAKLLKILAKSVYRPLVEENTRQQSRLCDQDEMMKVFYVVAELEQLATLVHEQVAQQIKQRIELEWSVKPYFGDILITYYHYYKVYKAILNRYPICQITLSILLKKKNFAAYLKKLLEAESENLEKINRLDMLLDRLVDLPRRSIQLLESYLKLLEVTSKEYSDIKKVLTLFTEIFESSNDALNKMNNFQLCYELQYMIEPPMLNIVDPNRQLIKQGPLYKVAKRNGELLLRHLALFTDMLLVCSCDRISRKLRLKYKIPSSKIKLIESSNDNNELMFRIISSDQNNEFKTDKQKEKDDWIKAFSKCKDLEIISNEKKEHTAHNSIQFEIGVNPPIWIKDNEQVTCSGCKELFNTFRRRHHCRTCGKIYCSSCCSCYVAVKFNEFKEKVRVCQSCFDLLVPVYQEHIKDMESPNQHLAPIQGSSLANTTIAFANDLIKNIKDASNSIKTTHGNSAKESSDKISTTYNNIQSNESNSSFEGAEIYFKAITAEKNRKVIRRKITDSEENIRASSPLNDEQMEFIRPFLENEPNNHTDDDDDDSSSDSEILDTQLKDNQQNVDLNIVIKRNNESKIQKPEHTVSLKPKLPEKPNNLKKSKSNTFLNDEKPITTTTTPTTISSDTPIFSSLAKTNSVPKYSMSTDAIHSEYGYLCKIPIKNSPSLDNLIDDTTVKWSHSYFIFNSNNSISVKASQHDKMPNLTIKLALFQLKDINDTTFGLYVINKEADRNNDLNNNNDENQNKKIQEVNQDSRAFKSTSSTKITSNDSIGSLKNKLKLFESNYELKFTNKESK